MKRSLILISVVLLVGAAPDPVKISPEKYKVLFENDRVRVLEVHLKAGETSAMHSHPDYIIYNFDACKVNFSYPDGKSEELELPAGASTFRAAESHEVKNTGSTDAHVLNIELKNGGEQTASAMMPAEHVVMTPDKLEWKDAPPSIPAGAKMAVLEGDMSKPGPFTFRVKVPAGFKIMPHWHPNIEHLTVISGKMGVGMGDQFDKSKGQTIGAGAFTFMPTKMHHFAWADEETEFQVHGNGPWGITYVNPADDPSKKSQ